MNEPPKDFIEHAAILRKILYWTQFIAGILIVIAAIIWFRQ